MHFSHPIARLSPAAVLVVLAATGGLANASSGQSLKANEQESAQQLVRQVVQNENAEQEGKPIYWKYLEIDTDNNTKQLFYVYETKAGTVKRLLAVNGEPLSPSQRRQQDAQLESILNHPSRLKEAARASKKDGEKERRLLAMLPDAFLFQYDGKVGDLVRLKFRPNPRFSPPTREAEVFHDMDGHLLVDSQQKRLAEIDGRLTTEVKFGWGLLGYLDRGGTFLVRQKQVDGKNWKMTRLRVNMNGKALFFKTIGVQENKRFENYRMNPADMTIRQAIIQLEKATLPQQVAEGMAIRRTG